MNEFLNPKSMSTPGAAGALMMLIANAFCSNFPECQFRYVALILSFVFGAIVFGATTMKVWERGIYWIVNSMIIFSMGVGASNIGANIEAKQASNARPASVVSAVMTAFADAAFAQEVKPPVPTASNQQNKATAATEANQPVSKSKADFQIMVNELEAKIRELKAANKSLQEKAPTMEKTQAQAVGKTQGGFFNRW